MSGSQLVDVLEGLGRPRILVLGDLILDRYTWGNAERISQEAPVVVLRVDRREARPGGAANVVNMLAYLDAQVTCAGIVGADAAGEELRNLLVQAGADCQLMRIDAARPTSVKERFVGRASSRHPSQILRVDHECCLPLPEEVEAGLIQQLQKQIGGHDVLLISDYGKGVCTPQVLRAAIDAARAANVTVIVDPGPACPLENYQGATMIKPNRLETELATGLKIAAPGDALAAGQELCRRVDSQMALITLDRDGMLLVDRDGHGEVFPTQARAVYDITGAGDMVLSVIGLCLGAGTRAAQAVRLANVAAGLEIERTGVAVISRDEIRAELLSGRHAPARKIVTLEQMAQLAREHRGRGERVVFTNGCFDLLHVGHVTCLAECAEHGQVLVVAVNSDASVRRLKGPSRPVIHETDRAAMLAALACVSYVVVFDDDTPHRLLEAIRPDVLIKGGTYTTDQIVGHEIVEAYGGTVCVAGVVDGISTTNILASLEKNEADPTHRPGPLPITEPIAPPPAAPWRRAG